MKRLIFVFVFAGCASLTTPAPLNQPETVVIAVTSDYQDDIVVYLRYSPRGQPHPVGKVGARSTEVFTINRSRLHAEPWVLVCVGRYSSLFGDSRCTETDRIHGRLGDVLVTVFGTQPLAAMAIG